MFYSLLRRLLVILMGKAVSELIDSLKGREKNFAKEFRQILKNVLEELRNKNLLSFDSTRGHADFLNILEDHSIKLPRAHNMLWEIFSEKEKSKKFAEHNREFGITERDLPYLLLTVTIYTFIINVELFKNSLLLVLKKEQGFKEKMTLYPFLNVLARNTKDGYKIQKIIDVNLRNAFSHGLFWMKAEYLCYYEDISLKKLCQIRFDDFIMEARKHNILCQLLIRMIPQLSGRSS